MRLLTKKEVSTSQASAKQTAINEGLKLAKRVDALREVSAAEEASLNKFRIKTLEKLGADIAAKEAEKEALLSEVRGLEERKTAALAPVDAYKSELHAEAIRLADVEEGLQRLIQAAVTKDLALTGRERDLVLQERQAEVIHTKATELYQDASTMKSNADLQNETASDTLRKAQQRAATLIANANERETWVAEREAAAFKKEEELRVKEVELAKDWSKLKDREATLERNIKRYAGK